MNYKTLWLGYNSNHVLIEFGVEQPDMRKSVFYCVKRWTKKMSENVQHIHSKLKGAAKYVKCYAGFEMIDSYDHCDSFDIPHAEMIKGSGKRLATINIYSSNDIPKDWKYNVTIAFKPGINMLQIRRAASAYGWDLTKDQEKGIKKALKEESGYSWDNYNEEF